MSFYLSYSALGAAFETFIYFSGIINGGPVVLVTTSILYFFFASGVACYLGEMCSLHPYVGSVYYWTAAYSNIDYARPFSFVCGQFYFVGCLTYDASVAYSIAALFPNLFSLMTN